MSAYLFYSFLILFSLFALTAGISQTFLAKNEKNEKELVESKKFQEAKSKIIEAQKNFKILNNRDTSSIDELISRGLLPQDFKISKYGKDFRIVGNEVILFSQLGEDRGFKQHLNDANIESFKAKNDYNNSEVLVEQQKKFNALRSNEKSITIGNDVTLTKSSETYK